MIVRDESAVIERLLASVHGTIDTWVICDTGSTDGTQAIIRQTLADIPGTLHETVWRDGSGWPLTQKTNSQLGLPATIPIGDITISSTP
jgi:glycosyltransferase involved in cell wall biosynthesis